MNGAPPDDASSMSDDVFEDMETTTHRRNEEQRRRIDDEQQQQQQHTVAGGRCSRPERNYATPQQYSTLQQQSHDMNYRTPSPSGYPGYRPPREAVQMYCLGDPGYNDDDDDYDDELRDDWKSYKYEDFEPPFDDTVNHKTILLGDSGVGKTSFLVKYNTGEFRAGSFSATVGIALTNKVVMVDNRRVKLQIWDTAGQERFRSVTHAYYRDAHALLLLYDVTRRTSFENVRAWLGEIREYASTDVVIMLLGNKADCSNSERQIKRDEGEHLAREYRVAFMETSAKSGLNVELAFLAVARQLKCRRCDSIDEDKFNVHDYVRHQNAAKQSCTQCFNTIL